MANPLMTFDEVIGQDNIKKWFRSAIDNNHLPQITMLYGPAGIGKTSLAKIVACEVAYRSSNPDVLQQAKQSVILESKNTDAVKVYNMSNLKSQEAVLEVKSDLNVGFSSTGRKVIIMDEAHGMSADAQDSLLTSFENLPKQVFIIVCTTNIENFRDAFLSRCIMRRLSSLTSADMRKLLIKRINDNGIRFDGISQNTAIYLLSNYTGREPRRAINLLDSFGTTPIIKAEDLDSFLNVREGKQIITLIRYLYNSTNLVAPLDFINELEITPTFITSLLDILRISQGAEPTIIDKNDTLFLRELVDTNGLDKLLGFIISCTTDNRLTRNKLSGYFLKYCNFSEIIESVPKRADKEQTYVEDLSIMRETLEQSTVNQNIDNSLDGQTALLSLAQLMSNSETIED